MTDYQVPASAIEAAARATFVSDGWEAMGSHSRHWDDPDAEDMRKLWRETAEAALRAAFDELGMTLESDYGDEKEARRVERFVSRWFEKP